VRGGAELSAQFQPRGSWTSVKVGIHSARVEMRHCASFYVRHQACPTNVCEYACPHAPTPTHNSSTINSTTLGPLHFHKGWTAIGIVGMGS
jgi:hypothetical protein